MGNGIYESIIYVKCKNIADGKLKKLRTSKVITWTRESGEPFLLWVKNQTTKPSGWHSLYNKPLILRKMTYVNHKSMYMNLHQQGKDHMGLRIEKSSDLRSGFRWRRRGKITTGYSGSSLWRGGACSILHIIGEIRGNNGIGRWKRKNGHMVSHVSHK